MKLKLQIKKEQFLFLLVSLLHVLPILIVPVFATLDGESHTYNSHILKEMLFGDNELFSRFHEVNFLLLPNVLGHFILMFFQFFTRDIISEKLFQITYIISFAYSFRYLSLSLNPNQKVASYFGFPLIYSFLFFLGFYNYCISLVFLFFAFGYWLRNRDLNSSREKIIMALLVLCVFLGHAFSFVLLLFSIGVFILTEFFYELRTKKFIDVFPSPFRKIINLVIAAIPSLILLLIYLVKFATSGEITYSPLSEKFSQLFIGRILISFGVLFEEPFSKLLVNYFYLLFIASLLIRFYKGKKIAAKNNMIYSDGLFFLVCAFVGIYIIIPESMASGEFMTVRMAFMLIIFITLSCGIFIEQLGKFKWVLILLPLFFDGALLYAKKDGIKSESAVAYEHSKMGKLIPPNSVVLYLHNSSDWFIPHFCSYLGLDQPIVLLNNYEPDKNYFPIVWRVGKNPYGKLGDYHGPDNCINVPKYERFSGEKIEYIVFLNQQIFRTDSCSVNANDFILREYDFITEFSNLALYKRKVSGKIQKHIDFDFESVNQFGIVDSVHHSGHKSFAMLSTKETQYSPGIEIRADEIGITGNSILEVSGHIRMQNAKATTQLAFMITRGDKILFYDQTGVGDNAMPLQWTSIRKRISPGEVREDDIVKLYFYQLAGPTTFVDDLSIKVIN